MLSVFEFIRYHYLNLHREESAPILYIVYIQAGVTKLPPELLWNLNTEFVPLVAVLDIRTEVLCVFRKLVLETGGSPPTNVFAIFCPAISAGWYILSCNKLRASA